LKNALGIWHGKMKGKDSLETAENFSILFILIGAVVLSVGIGLSIMSQRISFVFSVVGAWTALIFTVVLIFVWVAREFRSG
jgi:uncharacterized membrane protein